MTEAPATVSTLSAEDKASLDSIIERRNIIMQNILDVKKARLFALTELEREKRVAEEKRKTKAVKKRKAAKAARKINRRK